MANEVLKEADPALHEALAIAFEICRIIGRVPESWTEGEQVLILKPGSEAAALQLCSWRPITLLSAIHKLFMKVLNARITAWTQHSGWISWSQKGFQAGLDGCRETVFTLEQIIEISRRERAALRVLFVDFRNAFGTLSHGLIELGLNLALGECKVTQLIMATYRQASFRVRLPSGLTQPIRLGRGIMQGCTLSPTLFILAVEPLHKLMQTGYLDQTTRSWYRPGMPVGPDLKPGMPDAERREAAGFHISILGIADDTTIIAQGGNWQAVEREMVVQFRRLDGFCVWGNLEMKPPKCAEMAMGAGQRPLRTLALQPTKADGSPMLDSKGEPVTIPQLTSDGPYKALGFFINFFLDGRRDTANVVRKMKAAAVAIFSQSPRRSYAVILAQLQKQLFSQPTYWVALSLLGLTAIDKLDTWVRGEVRAYLQRTRIQPTHRDDITT